MISELEKNIANLETEIKNRTESLEKRKKTVAHLKTKINDPQFATIMKQVLDTESLGKRLRENCPEESIARNLERAHAQKAPSFVAAVGAVAEHMKKG